MSGMDSWRQQFKAFFSWGWRHGSAEPIAPMELIELPMSPAHVTALRHHVLSERQIYLGFMAAGVTAALLFSAIPFPGQAIPLWLSVSIGGVIAGIAFVADWFYWRRGHEAELRRGVYIRVSGPIRVRSGNDTGSVQVGDVKIRYVRRIVCRELRDLPFGYIDYAPRSRLILEQRDADGELLYRNTEYRPDDDPAATPPLPSLIVGILWGVGGMTVLMLSLIGLALWADSRR